ATAKNISSRFYDSNGHATETEQDDSDFLGGGDHDPDVAIDLFGNYAVSFTEDVSFNTDSNVRAKEFDRNHNLLSNINVGVTTFADETHSSVAIPSDNTGFDIAYQRQFHGSSQVAIVLNQYGSNGQLITNGVNVISNGTDSRNPSVAMDHVGNAVVVYQSRGGNGTFDIKARRVSIAGAVGSEIDVRSTGAQ